MATNKGVRRIKAKIDGDNIVLALPIKNLVWACEHQPEYPLKVKDKKAFAKYIAEMLWDHDEDENGATAMMRLLDELFVSAYEDGVDMEEKVVE
jgi:hypothetical protein